MDDLIKRITELERKVNSGRIFQQDITPGAIKQRHISEGVIFIRSGLAASRPVTPESSRNGLPIYWASDTFVLSIWTGSAWKTVTLS